MASTSVTRAGILPSTSVLMAVPFRYIDIGSPEPRSSTGLEVNPDSRPPGSHMIDHAAGAGILGPASLYAYLAVGLGAQNLLVRGRAAVL
ncbi:hypothetical protein GCM10018779_37840 [Streptomyces griseocarneus]|nr:hypothetical protein GCM10018779_37840 [Streptomyces griseocarneus]